jgi:hypothetical protein
VVNEVVGDDEKYSIFGAFSAGIAGTEPAKLAGGQLGSVNGVAPTEANVQNGNFPFSRFLYNVYRQAGAPAILSPATGNFVGNNGWICKGEGGHSKPVGHPEPGIESSAASVNYNSLIKSIIQQHGLVLIRNSGNRCNFTDVVNP